jgi:hypothetical protein
VHGATGSKVSYCWLCWTKSWNCLLHLGPLDSMVLAIFLFIHCFILFMKSEVLCLNLIFLITFIFSLKRHHFLPYHLDQWYHIHPKQAQDQPTTQVNLFLITRKLLFDTFNIISKISKHVTSKIIFSQSSTTRYKQASYFAKILKQYIQITE